MGSPDAGDLSAFATAHMCARPLPWSDFVQYEKMPSG
jgi:hypothetical protein